jgi:hypothetical protein
MKKMVIASLLVVSLVVGCAAIKPIIRTIVDVAEILCILTAEKQNQKALMDMTPQQWCAVETNLQPFIDQLFAAQKAAAVQKGFKVEEK